MSAVGDSTVDDLVRWLTEVWDEQEAAAKAAAESVGSAEWTTTAYSDHVYTVTSGNAQEVAADGYGRIDDDRRYFIAAHDPASVLARIAADRKILEHILDYESTLDGEFACCHTPDEIRAGECPTTPVNEINAIRAMASAYKDRPGYQESWAVQ